MAIIIREENKKKWLMTFYVLISLVTTYSFFRFIEVLSYWFDLEAKIPHFPIVHQFISIATLFTVLGLVNLSQAIKSYLDEVYSELLKVVWPDRHSVTKMCFGILAGVSIVSVFFMLIDFILGWILSFLY